MTKRFQLLQRRFGNARPGLQLVAVEDAAIPVSVLRADVLAQERKELPITDEFTLLFVEHGVESPEEIAAFLGLDSAHVLEAAAAQLGENSLRRRSDGKSLTLTPIGTEVVRNAATIRPTFRNLPVKFDRVVWQPTDYSENSLIPKKVVDDLGHIRLPAERKARIGLGDVTAPTLNALLRSGNLQSLQVLQIHKVSTKKNLYLPVQLLVYADQIRGEIELAVCIDDQISDAHGDALDRTEVVKHLRMSIGEPTPRPTLDADLEEQREGAKPAHVPGDVLDPALSEDLASTSQVRSVSVFEHPDLLAEALDTTTKRLLIISPWIRRAVVNTDFLAKIEGRLRRGVALTIAHGYGGDDSGSDTDALRKLQNLASRYSSKFNFVRLKNTHAKILIFDDHWVSTSFNWLSFRGDPDRTYRMEEGTLVSIPARTDKQYDRYLEMIDEQQI
ncbi:hypothetical protein ACFO6V_17825 [Promicromonospora alba]|uniref:Phospholipase D-like protein n=1 Tax=Promicromonospora alba TaxID=1616110 RepID=A0ABV9HJ00_9MICO